PLVRGPRADPLPAARGLDDMSTPPEDRGQKTGASSGASLSSVLCPLSSGAMALEAAFEKRFPGGPAIRAGLHVPADTFSVTILFGPSGSGKTPVLRCLAGLERAEGGVRPLPGAARCERAPP